MHGQGREADHRVTSAPGPSFDPFDTPDSAEPDAGPEFEAEYDGNCIGCFDPIEEGDLIRGVDQGDYIHADCYEEWARG